MYHRPFLRISLFFLCCFQFLIFPRARAQEFPRGGIVFLEANQGLNTTFHGYKDLYVGGLQLQPQWTILPGALRLGVAAGASYSDQHVFGLFGPTVAWKLATIPAGTFGSIGNFQLQAGHLWGTFHQKLIGAGFKLQLQILTLGITAYKDYGQNSWWFQTGIGYNLTQEKRPSTPIDPLR